MHACTRPDMHHPSPPHPKLQQNRQETVHNIHHGKKNNEMNGNKSQAFKRPLVAVGAGEALSYIIYYLLLSCSMLVHDYYYVTRHAKKYDIDI